MRKRGITLIELCVFILLVGICALPIIMMLNYSLRSSATELIMTTAIGLAEGKMEELIGKDFYALREEYRGYTGNTTGDQFFVGTAPINSYKYNVTIKPINPAYLGTDFADTAAEVTVPAGQPTPHGNFLRVYLEVWNKSLPNKRVRLYTILTPHRY